MILVRIVFQTKWGKSGEVAKLLAESVDDMADVTGAGRVRILTDLSGPFHTVVQEIEVESLAQWEATRAKVFTHPEFQKRMARTEGLLESGYQEFYTVEYAS